MKRRGDKKIEKERERKRKEEKKKKCTKEGK